MVFGGNSDEHFVSVHTAITFIRYLWDSPVISIQPFYISRTGNYYLIDRSELIKISDSFFFNEEDLEKQICFIYSTSSNNLEIYRESQNKITFDVIFPVILGNTGEDGTIYNFFRLLGQKVVGPRAVISAILFDKILSKAIFEYLGFCALPYYVPRPSDTASEVAKYIKDRIKFPCVIKPASQGSSIGLSVCKIEEELSELLVKAYQFSDFIIIEPFEKVTELFCYTWRQNNNIRTSSITSVKPVGDVYDFDQKYIAYSSVEFDKYDDSSDISKSLRIKSEKLYDKLDGNGIWRVDFFKNTQGDVFINEVNTMPAFVNVFGRDHPLNMNGNSMMDILEDLILSCLQPISPAIH
tara:strand:- start:1220 stop:2278 length:1059 start_codon:yes stop_codon:yes gene_type:complete